MMLSRIVKKIEFTEKKVDIEFVLEIENAIIDGMEKHPESDGHRRSRIYN